MIDQHYYASPFVPEYILFFDPKIFIEVDVLNLCQCPGLYCLLFLKRFALF